MEVERDNRGYSILSWLGGGLVSLFVCAGILPGIGRQKSISVPDAALKDDRWVADTRCAECHIEAETFAQTGHALALRRASDEFSRSRLLLLNVSPVAREAGLRIEERDSEIHAIHNAGGVERDVVLDWCFGSGRFDLTWVGTLVNSWGADDLIEFRYTYYCDPETFDVTPGHPAVPHAGHFGQLGVLHDPPKTYRCFACHASQLTFHDGRLDLSKIHLGVSCQRCHGPMGEHVRTDGEFVDRAWQPEDRMAAVHRCAQCHRRAEEREPEEIHPDNLSIVRFQPVGLVQSACFRASEMTCTTCHDPHRTMAAQDSRGIWQCVQCHDPTQVKQTTCAAGHRDDCLRCHMPRLQMNSPLSFTDHWIRIRDPQP